MSETVIYINFIWASVSVFAIFVSYKCFENYIKIKSLEALALTSERVGAVVLKVLKENGGRFRSLPAVNGTPQNRPPHHATATQKEEVYYPHSNPLFDLHN